VCVCVCVCVAVGSDFEVLLVFPVNLTYQLMHFYVQ